MVFRIAMAVGPTRMTRDVRIMHRQLVAQRRAVWLGETFPQGPPPPPLDDVQRAVARVKALFEEATVTRERETRGTADRARSSRVDEQTEATAS
jgi:hypothetical protein